MVLTLYGKPIHQAVATSAGIVVPITLAGTAGYVLAGLPHQAQLPPLSVGFVSMGETTSFSFVVRLFVNVATTPPEIVASRTVSDVRFAGGETVMLRLSLPRVCACHGTSCPLPGNPACDNLQNPRLEPFDPDKAPPSTMMTYPVMVF